MKKIILGIGATVLYGTSALGASNLALENISDSFNKYQNQILSKEDLSHFCEIGIAKGEEIDNKIVEDQAFEARSHEDIKSRVFHYNFNNNDYTLVKRPDGNCKVFLEKISPYDAFKDKDEFLGVFPHPASNIRYGQGCMVYGKDCERKIKNDLDTYMNTK